MHSRVVHSCLDSKPQPARCNRYPRSSIKALAPGAAVRGAKSFTPDMVRASADGSVRRVGPFEMRPAAGAGAALVLGSLGFPPRVFEDLYSCSHM